MFKNNSSQVAALISPVHGCRDALRRKGKKPKDHHKDNVKYIKTVASLKKVKKTTVKRAASTIVGKNFVRENMKNVKNFQVSAPIESSDEEIFNVGEVPEYIGSIKNMLRTKKEER
jgi:CxxC motif-containing protein